MAGPAGADTAPTLPWTVMAVVTGVVDALQPVVATPRSAVPLKAGFQVTIPEVPETLMLPAPEGDIDQIYPVALLTAPVV